MLRTAWPSSRRDAICFTAMPTVMLAQLTPHLNMGNICWRVSPLAASSGGRRSPVQQLPFLSVTDVRGVHVSWLLIVKKAFKLVSYSCSPPCLDPSEAHWGSSKMKNKIIPLHGADTYFVDLSLQSTSTVFIIKTKPWCTGLKCGCHAFQLPSG